jgi:hypothetical protein
LQHDVVPAAARRVEAIRAPQDTCGSTSTEICMKDTRRVGSSPFRLCFRSLFDRGRGYAFPCDGNGRVDLDELSERARNNYFYARAMVGRELAVPAVELTELH